MICIVLGNVTVLSALQPRKDSEYDVVSEVPAGYLAGGYERERANCVSIAPRT